MRSSVDYTHGLADAFDDSRSGNRQSAACVVFGNGDFSEGGCIVKCFRSLAALTFVLTTAAAVDADDDCAKTSEMIERLLLARHFAQAEPLVRTCLSEHPGQLSLLSKLDIVLNGQGKRQAADQVRERILQTWHRNHEADWRARGSPVAEATWARMVSSSQEYYVIGAEYYVPEVLGAEPPQILVYYKVIALPRVDGKSPRLFKLEMSDLGMKFYVLRETFRNGGRQVKPYGNDKPDLPRVVIDAIHFLDSEDR